MAYPELYLNLNYNQKVMCAIAIIGLVILVQIVTTMKNKTKKVTRKQITHRYAKIDLCRNLVANTQQDFIGERKLIFNELVRM